MKYPRFLFNREWWSFLRRYRQGNTPWDTQITPPEVMAFLEKTMPGRALDLGCGTGTNAVTLAKRGWQVTGIDFVPKAIRAARRKAGAANLPITFHVGDVTRIPDIATGPFDYVLDIGCLHALHKDQRKPYADGLEQVLRPGGSYMLYAWLPVIRNGRRRGISAESLHALFDRSFIVEDTVVGEEGGSPTAWYWFTKKE